MSALVTAPPIIVDGTNLPAPFGTLTNPFGIWKVGSALYQVLQYQVASGGVFPIGVYKSTDSGNTWVEQDIANHPTVTDTNNSGRVAFFNPATGVISILILGTSGTNFIYTVGTFNTGSDTYSAVSSASAGFTGGDFPGIYQKSTGDIVTPGNQNNALEYLTLIAGTWAGPTAIGSNPGISIYGVVVDSSDNGHLIFNDNSGNLVYALLSPTFTLGSPTTLSSSSDFDGLSTDQLIWSGNIVVAWTENTVLKVAIGTPLSGVSFTTYTVGTVAGTGTLSYPTLAIDKDGNLVVFAQWNDTTTGPVTDQLLMWTFDGVSSWGSPAEFYDAIGNPPPSPPAASSQFMLTGAAIQLSDGTWVFSAQLASGAQSQVSFVLTSGSGVPVLTPPAATGQKTVPYSSAVGCTGGTSPYTFSITSGSLPPGLNLNTTTGAITGTPTTTGVYPFTAHVIDSGAQTDDLPCTITITQPTVTCPANSTAIRGVAYTGAIGASGGTAPYAFSITSGSLPPGLSLDGATGDITGTATAVGNYPYTAQITDSLGKIGSGSCSYTVLNPAPTPLLGAGPVQLPANKYRPDTVASVIESAQVYGPFTPSASPNTKVIITIIQTSPDVSAAGNLAAMVSRDNGATWTQVNGPSIGFYSVLTFPYVVPTQLNCFRLNDDVFTLSTPAASTLALYSFSLSSLTWTTRNPAIASPPNSFAPFILGINSSGIGIAITYLDGNVPVILPPSGDSQGAPHVMIFNALTGENLFEQTIFEPDTPYSPTAASDSDWQQLWPFYSVKSGSDLSGGIFGVDVNGNFWASGRQYSYDGNLLRQRTMMWPASPSSALPVFSVSATASIDPSLVNTVNMIGQSQSAVSAYSNVLRVTDGAAAIVVGPSVSGSDVAWSAKALVMVPDPSLSLGRLAFALGISSSNFGATRTFLVSTIQSPGYASGGTTAIAAGNSPSYDAFLGQVISAEISGNFIDVVTKGSIPPFAVDGYLYFVPLYYWRISLVPGGLSLLCPVGGGIAQFGAHYDFFLQVIGGTAPFTFAIISGGLPPGLSLNPATGEISGVPTSNGIFNYVAQVTDANGNTAHT